MIHHYIVQKMRFVAVFLAAFLATGIVIADDELTVAALIEKMQAFKERFEKHTEWQIEYTRTIEYRAVPPEYKGRFPNWKIINTRKGEWAYLYHEVMPNGDFKGSKEWALWKDDVCIDRTGPAYQIMSDYSPVLLDQFYFTNLLFLNIHPQKKFSGDFAKALGGSSPNELFQKVSLPESVKNDVDSYKIKPERERVDGDLCVVLEKENTDQIWLDLDHGGICRRRKLSMLGQMAIEYTNDHLEKYADDLWLPKHEEESRYNGPDTAAEFRGKIRTVQKYDLVQIKFGDIPNSIFDVPMPNPGYVNDHIQGKIYRTDAPDAPKKP